MTGKVSMECELWIVLRRDAMLGRLATWTGWTDDRYIALSFAARLPLYTRRIRHTVCRCTVAGGEGAYLKRAPRWCDMLVFTVKTRVPRWRDRFVFTVSR